MNARLISVLFVVAGIVLVVVGSRREDSLAGLTDSMAAKAANTWDGAARQPDHIWYYVGGGVLILAGILGAVRRRKAN